jgi:hypothetical protein
MNNPLSIVENHRVEMNIPFPYKHEENEVKKIIEEH